MTDRELMQQALEALDYEAECGNDDAYHPLRAALRERLAQPEMQPCAGRNCGSTNPNLHSAECFEDYEKSTGMAQPEQEPVAWEQFHEHMAGPFYTTPPQRSESSGKPSAWVGLTRDEQSFVYSNLHNATSREDSFWVDFANAIEAKLKEKNA